MSMAERLRFLAKRAGKTQVQISKEAKVSKSTLNDLFLGKVKSCSMNVARNLARTLNTTIDYLVSGEEIHIVKDDFYNFSKSSKILAAAPVIDWSEIETWKRDKDQMMKMSSYETVILQNNESDETIALEIINDVMSSNILNSLSFNIGDLITVDPFATLEANDFVVCKADAKSPYSLKQYKVVDGVKILVHLNTTYQPTTTIFKPETKIYGVVTSKLTKIK